MATPPPPPFFPAPFSFADESMVSVLSVGAFPYTSVCVSVNIWVKSKETVGMATPSHPPTPHPLRILAVIGRYGPHLMIVMIVVTQNNFLNGSGTSHRLHGFYRFLSKSSQDWSRTYHLLAGGGQWSEGAGGGGGGGEEPSPFPPNMPLCLAIAVGLGALLTEAACSFSISWNSFLFPVGEELDVITRIVPRFSIERRRRKGGWRVWLGRLLSLCFLLVVRSLKSREWSGPSLTMMMMMIMTTVAKDWSAEELKSLGLLHQFVLNLTRMKGN